MTTRTHDETMALAENTAAHVGHNVTSIEVETARYPVTIARDGQSVFVDWDQRDEIDTDDRQIYCRTCEVELAGEFEVEPVERCECGQLVSTWMADDGQRSEWRHDDGTLAHTPPVPTGRQRLAAEIDRQQAEYDRIEAEYAAHPDPDLDLLQDREREGGRLDGLREALAMLD